MFGLWPRFILDFTEEFFMSLMGSRSRVWAIEMLPDNCCCHLKRRSTFNNSNRITKRKNHILPEAFSEHCGLYKLFACNCISVPSN